MSSILPMIKNGHMAAPALLMNVDRKVFAQSGTDRGRAYTEKGRHRKELRQAYGDNWKKHLNVPERKLENTVRLSF